MQSIKTTAGSARTDHFARLVSRRQLQDHFRVLPVAIAATFLNMIVVAWVFRQDCSPVLLGMWCLILAVVTVARWLTRKRFLNDTRLLAAYRAHREVDATAFLLGGLWGIGIGYLLTIASAAELGVLGLLGGGMMGAAVLTYGPMPRAVSAYVGAISISAAIGFALTPNAEIVASLVLLGSYAMILIRAAYGNHASLIEKLRGELAVTESSETVRLLLNDYESQSADWLWEIDGERRLGAPSVRFAEAAERPIELLAGAPLVDLFDAGPERDQLAEHIEANRPFRDLTLPLTIGESPHWWTLSARPSVIDGNKVMRGVATDITAAKRAEQRMSYMAHYDGLTDLANRFLFNESLKRALNRREKFEQVTVLYLDLDHFKAVNDTLGHPTGDQLLRAVARRIEESARESDLVARLGGDEFAVLMCGLTDMAEADACAARIVAAIEAPFDLEGHRVLTSTSIGVAFAKSGKAAAVDLLKQADLALYSAKANGRNRAAHFELGMDEAARDRRELEMDLRSALSNDQFELHYQPLVNVETGETVSYEALIRWEHPTRGVVMPDEFIPLAEETGLIVQVGEWVLRNAISEVARWTDNVNVSVNLSPVQMRSANLITTIVNAIAHAGISPNRLELEITENVLLHDSAVNIATLHKLRDLGVRISLDDFGTGYSSLNYLRSFPFDKIKIDRCFVEDIDSREDCRAIVKAVTGLASSLGMVTTAEGVERTDQLNELRAQGCTEVQGYLFSRPLRAEEYSNLRLPAKIGTIARAANISAITPMLPAIDIALEPVSKVKRRVSN